MANLSKWNPFLFIAYSGPERFAVGRVNTLLARIFAIGGLAVGLQMLLNAWGQRDILMPWVFWPGFLAVAVGQIGLIYGAFVSGKNQFWQRWYARSIELVIVTWFLGMPAGQSMPDGVYPWAWWGVGLAAVAAFAGLPPFRAILFFVVLDLFWFFARFFPSYGAVDLWLNVQDTLLTFLFAAVLGSLIFVTRYEAAKVDLASERKLTAAADQARAEAAIREKARLDALVHDKVLTTLVLAAKASTPEERDSVAGLAISAITALNSVPNESSDSRINGSSLFAALEKIALAQLPDLAVTRTEIDMVWVPETVATALSEAMLQAIANSQLHAGQGANRELHLKGHKNGLKIVIKDDGRGFRMSRVPKNRLGIRVSIVERLESVGGRAFIDSRPGSGTNIILEWGTDA
jgi:signal transduction histidine kinase